MCLTQGHSTMTTALGDSTGTPCPKSTTLNTRPRQIPTCICVIHWKDVGWSRSRLIDISRRYRLIGTTFNSSVKRSVYKYYLYHILWDAHYRLTSCIGLYSLFQGYFKVDNLSYIIICLRSVIFLVVEKTKDFPPNKLILLLLRNEAYEG